MSGRVEMLHGFFQTLFLAILIVFVIIVSCTAVIDSMLLFYHCSCTLVSTWCIYVDPRFSALLFCSTSSILSYSAFYGNHFCLFITPPSLHRVDGVSFNSIQFFLWILSGKSLICFPCMLYFLNLWFTDNTNYYLTLPLINL